MGVLSAVWFRYKLCTLTYLSPFILVGAAGFEPTLTESESGVLPLNYAPSTADYKAFLFSMQAES